ncbi:MAG: hypothetical protein R2730_16545 [Chitinophagales bacterium]
MLKFFAILTFIVCLFSANVLFAHGDLHVRIELATAAIQLSPDNAELYLERGILLYQHEKYSESIDDFNHCISLNYNTPKLYLAIAKSQIALNNAESAIQYLDKILKEDQHNVITLRWKARALMQMNQYSEAAYYFEDVIRFANQTFTENYIEAALAWENSDQPNNLENAIAIIEKGISDLGDILILYDKLVELHQLSGNTIEAINIQGKIIDLSNRKERPYYARAVLYQSIGDMESAKADFNQSKMEIKKLPYRIKNTNATLTLVKSIQEKEALFD